MTTILFVPLFWGRRLSSKRAHLHASHLSPLPLLPLFPASSNWVGYWFAPSPWRPTRLHTPWTRGCPCGTLEPQRFGHFCRAEFLGCNKKLLIRSSGLTTAIGRYEQGSWPRDSLRSILTTNITRSRHWDGCLPPVHRF